MLSLEAPYSSSKTQLTKNARILVIEDEDLIRNMIGVALKEEGYDVIEMSDGQSALNFLQSQETASMEDILDLIVLDLMLPQVNGLDICRFLRYQGNTVPVLILSAKVSETDRVLGLEVGADDYLTKPFSMRELVARCRALLRRQQYLNVPHTAVKQFKDVMIFPEECRANVRGEDLNLSPKEYKILELFLSYPKRVWSREQLIENIWGMDFVGDTKTVDVHIRWLREKLELDPSNPEYIITVRGFGYRFG